jgi:hypothetical protein
MGRAAEVTRDELKFSKFVDRLRGKFSEIFNQTLRVQCVLKGICTAEEWEEFKQNIHYNYIKDNNFSELKEAELMTNRLQLLGAVDPYTGRYFSQKWIQQNVLRLSDDDIREMQKEIDGEKKDGLGLPVGVMNDVAQQQMMSQVPQQPQNPDDQQHQMDMQQQAADQSATQQKEAQKEAVAVFTKLKQIL